ncbi:MAG: LacI family DNA-binding transcriptional regulator [Caldilineaceae bacterium]|nr:LacI family DNA-binding transcriptional regulator [Caldilineaceae bacterium]
MNRKRVSIKDIAALAGVSHPTVSRALRGEGRISDETRSRIMSIAQEIGYMPNLVARGLVMQRTNSIGLVVTNIGDPFHSEIIRGVEFAVRDNGYSLFLGSTTADPEQEVRVVHSFRGRSVDGIIIASSEVGAQYAEMFDDGLHMDVPIVLISSHAEGSPLHSVTHDDYGGARQVMAHLLEQGYRRIAYLGHRFGGRVNAERRRAWQETLQSAGLAPFLAINSTETTLDHGVASVNPLLRRADEQWGALPDAVFCYNDLLAIGLISGLRAQNLSVPEDVAVAGFDGLDVAAHIEPPLTTMSQPRYEMGLRAANILLDLLKNHDHTSQPPQELSLRGELLVRRSTVRNSSGG